MKLDQLVMLKTVAELGTLRLASEHLHKTQPAISQGIRQLESSLKITLFSRTKYRLALTDEGKMVYQHAVRLLDEAATLRQVANHIAEGNETSITLAIEATFDLKGILPLLESVQTQFPGTQIILKQEYITGAVEALNSGNATLCVSPMDGILNMSANMDSHFLIEGALINVAAPKLIARHPELLTSRDLINEYQIILQDSGMGSKDTEWGVQDGQRRWYVNDYATKKMLIESGMGWGKLPNHYAQPGLESGSLAPLELNDMNNRVALNHHIIKNRKEILGPVAQVLWDQFKAYTFNTF